jgi:cytochrome b pre-mRNA-processing protein 3
MHRPPESASATVTIPMILWPFRRRAEQRTIATLYGAIVTQARSTAFYANFGVPDTVQGRFDLIVLHLVLLLRRLGKNGAGQALGQGLFDTFCRDLDDNLREMGIGDLAVPKHIRRFGEAFYGRQAAYLAALDAQEGPDFENALARNIFQVVGPDERAARLARYAWAALQELDVQEHGSITRGEVAFPKPEAFANVRP